jgi:hypothetical protein
MCWTFLTGNPSRESLPNQIAAGSALARVQGPVGAYRTARQPGSPPTGCGAGAKVTPRGAVRPCILTVSVGLKAEKKDEVKKIMVKPAK